MNANLMKKTIEMSKTEAKAAGKIGSEEFKELRQYMEMYPTFTIDVKADAVQTENVVPEGTAAEDAAWAAFKTVEG